MRSSEQGLYVSVFPFYCVRARWATLNSSRYHPGVLVYNQIAVNLSVFALRMRLAVVDFISITRAIAQTHTHPDTNRRVAK